MGSYSDYKNKALNSLEGKWSTVAIATLIFLVISAGINWSISVPMGTNWVMSYSTQGLWTLLCLPLGWGFVVYFLRLIRNDELGYGRLFDGYKDFLRVFIATFLYELAMVIGLILLIVPGIILGAGLVMTNFILKDDPQIGAIDALAKSWKMTSGHKADLVGLFFSFLGWIILSIFTLGIGFLFLYPYMYSTLAHYYEDLKAQQPEII
jgi:uncharacterized membrane protein